MRFNREKTLSR